VGRPAAGRRGERAAGADLPAAPRAVIESRPAGYQLKLDPRSTDIVRFEELATQGRAQLRDDPAAAAATLREALALWRGPALMDVADRDFSQAVVARLDELRLLATENRVDADLRTGVTATLVAKLEGLVVAHPMREPLAAGWPSRPPVPRWPRCPTGYGWSS
jgi:DNA-binding SARP family transcriptional activator